MTQNFESYSVGSEDLDKREMSGGAEHSPHAREDEDADGGDWIKVGEVALSPGLRKATYGSKELRLTSAEFNILEYLLRSRGTVVSREDLVQTALGRHLGTLDRSVDVHISRLRRKLIQCGADDTHIKAVRGAGYIYTALPTDMRS
jgi:DNA-binding response OmpR family regulator